MNRDRSPTGALHPALLHPNEVSRLQTVFRRALKVAFASSLMAAGCNTTHGTTPGEQGGGGTGGSGSDVVMSGAPAPSAGRTSTPTAGRPSVPRPTAGTTGTAGKPSSGPRDAGPEPDAGDPDLDAGGGGPGGEGVPPVCDPQWQMLADLNPAMPFDFAAYRTRYMYTPMIMEQVRTGTPCDNATQADACQMKLESGADALTSWQPCGQVGQCIHYVVTTRGDEIRHYSNVDEVKAFLGPIDRPQEALLLLHYLGYDISCETTRVWTVRHGFEATVQIMVADCPVQMANVRAYVSSDGRVTEQSRELLPPTNQCIGRRPEGLIAPVAARSSSELGAHFASIAQLEAASVAAFDVLARELEAHHAPAELIAAAREAARDEVRHAARTSQLARRFGVTPVAPRVEPRPLRALDALALDNAVEGCVRETFGAAIGCYQAQAARDPEIAAAMTEIAGDETRHAALALAIHAWVWPRLPADTRAAIEQARAAAVRELAHELRAEPNRSVRELAGLPDAATAAQLHEAVQRELWS